MNIRDHLSRLSPEEIQSYNAIQVETHKRAYNDFLNAFEKGCCSYCGMKLNYFNESERCLHWFLLPEGIRKRHFESYLQEPIGFFKLDFYLRWVASIAEPLKNINDLSQNISKSKIVERTIKFKNIEWSFNYGETDLNGHDSMNANFPHFHIQINKDDKPFIRFNDCHIPFSKHDLDVLQTIKEAPDLFEVRHIYGEGMSFIENQENTDLLDETMLLADDPNSAALNTRSIIQIPNGQSISSVMIDKLYIESRETKIPFRNLLKKYYPDAKIDIQIEPGNGVPEMKKRRKR
jgi:hypothetical protein